MKFFALVTFLATAALTLAMPHAPSTSDSHDEIEQTQNTCGNAQLSCCQEFDSSASVSEEEEFTLLTLLGDGLLNNGALGKYHGCSALVSLQGTVGGQCNNHVACCNGASSENNGLVNVAIPCLPLNLL